MLSPFSRVQLFVTLCIVAYQAPLSMGFSKQEHWSGLPCPSPGDLPDPGIKPESLLPPTLAGRFFTTSATWEALWEVTYREMPWRLAQYTGWWWGMQGSFLKFEEEIERILIKMLEWP